MCIRDSRSKVHLRLRSGSLSAIALFQKVHLRLRIFCLFALTELTLFMHRIGTFEKRAMRLRSGSLSAIALFQKVHLRLRFFLLICVDQIDTFGAPDLRPCQKCNAVKIFFTDLRAPNLRFGALRMNTLVWQHMNRCLFARWAWRHQRGKLKCTSTQVNQRCMLACDFNAQNL